MRQQQAAGVRAIEAAAASFDRNDLLCGSRRRGYCGSCGWTSKLESFRTELTMWSECISDADPPRQYGCRRTNTNKSW